MADARFSPRISIYKLINGQPSLIPIKWKDLSYTSTEKKADKCTFTFLNDQLIYPDDPTFDCGAELAVSWGYPGNMSPMRTVIVQKYTPGYPDFKVECAGKGILLHKIKDARSWDHVKRSDVARELAEKWGYGPELQDIDDTEEVYDHITKSMMTDAAFLTKMAAKEAKRGNGFVFAVDQAGFHFCREKLSAPPLKTFRFIPHAKDQGDLKSFPTFDAVSAQNKPGKVTTAGVDLTTGKKVGGTASNETDPGRATMGSHVIVFAKVGTYNTTDTNGASAQNFTDDPRVSSGNEANNAAVETTVATGARSDTEAKKAATASFSASTGKASKCTISVLGDPRLFAKDVVRMEGIGKRLSGNYYVSEAHHDVKPGDYTLNLKTRRDALSAGTGTGGSGGSAGAASKAPQSQQDIASQMAVLVPAVQKYREAIANNDPEGQMLYQQDAEKYLQLQQQLAAAKATTTGKVNDTPGTDIDVNAPPRTETKIVYATNGTSKVQFVPSSGGGSAQ